MTHTLLNLPKHSCSIPMKAQLPIKEPDIQALWRGLYASIRHARSGRPTFTLKDGPPYANGPIHLGHALNKILKDIIVKSKILSGFDPVFQPGWDCHGLPIELKVEQSHARNHPHFYAYCRQYAQEQINIQKQAFQRLGILSDWEHPYTTMDFSYEAMIMRSISKLIQQGQCVQGAKPVHWCTVCQSALAEAEVEYASQAYDAIDVAFEVACIDDFQSRIQKSIKGPAYMMIWTTTPWTLPANQAVCLHPDLLYAVIETPKGLIVIAERLWESCLKRYNLFDNASLLTSITGRNFEYLSLRHPFYTERCVPVICGQHVTDDAGTGCVHTAPAHGPEDHQVGLLYRLSCHSPVQPNGRFHEENQPWHGASVLESSGSIMQALGSHLWHHARDTHAYPMCWRHHTPLIFRATPQWFISMDSHQLREKTLQSLDQVQWHPTWGQERMRHMIERRPDWCISRQRTWVVPIPVFMHRITRNIPENIGEIIEYIAQQVEKKGMEAWQQITPEDVGLCSQDYEKSVDGLDVWVDSGLSHHGQIADLYLEGSDQYRGWFQSSIITSMALHQQVPYRSIVTHGFCVDQEGHKMSKSLGNVIDPLEVTQTLGADILRLWVAMTDYRHEMAISKEILDRASESYRRIRNTARFLLSNLYDAHDWLFSASISDLKMTQLDLDILHQANIAQTFIQDAYDQYRIHDVYQRILQFCISDLGGFYLDIIKDRLYTLGAQSPARQAAQWTCYQLLHMLMRWIAPILSHTAEEIYQYLPHRSYSSVFFETWTQLSTQSCPVITCLKTLRHDIHQALEQARVHKTIGSTLEASLTIFVDPATHDLLLPYAQELKFFWIVSEVRLMLSESPARAVVVDVKPHARTKCTRCWHRVDLVHTEDGVCYRCHANIKGDHEIRMLA